MSTPAVEPLASPQLRARATSRLTRPAHAKGSAVGAADALAVLFSLASSPDTAADALALLHELQVHQVELDLQAEELRDARTELEAALRRQAALYDHQPVACLTVDRALRVCELNLAGARLLGLARDTARGLPLDKHLGAEGSDTLRGLLVRIEAGEPHAATVLIWRPAGGPSQRLRADISADPAGQCNLLVLTGYNDSPPPQAPQA